MLKRKILDIILTEKQAALFYLGQEGFIIKYGGVYILIDGYLSDYVDKNCSGKVKWIRRYAPPIQAEDLDFIDYVFCTHGHYDHTDPYTIAAISRVNSNATFIAPRAIFSNLLSYGVDESKIISATADEVFNIGDIKVAPIPAAHEGLHKNESGDYLNLGFILSFGEMTLFHAGDCCVYNGLADRIRGVDVALLPINGRDYFRTANGIIGNMDSAEALQLAADAGVRLVIPMHFDLYDVNGVNPAYFVDCAHKQYPFQAFHIFTPGSGYILTGGQL